MGLKKEALSVAVFYHYMILQTFCAPHNEINFVCYIDSYVFIL